MMKPNKIIALLLSVTICASFAYAKDENTVKSPENKPVKTVAQPVILVDNKNSQIDEKTQSILDKIGFGKFFDSSGTKEIESFFKTFEKYMLKGDFQKLKSLYSDDFVNNDGFNKNSYFDLIELVSDLYQDAQYTMKVVSIERNGDFADVTVNESASAVTTVQYEGINGRGVVKSDSKYLYHLAKISGKWKICALDTIAEKTSLAYGDAIGLEFQLDAPSAVKQGSKYPITFSVSEIPSDAIFIASLTNDPIIYPQINKQEVFRTLKKSKTLERIVEANRDNYNEYATASLGITKAGIAKNDDINMVKIFMTGMAFVMSRVNVLPVVEHKVKKDKNGKVEE